MANNVTIKDGGGSNATVRTTETAGVHTPHHNVDALPPIPPGSNDVGDVGVRARTSGGLTPHKLVSAASTNATSVKASAGQVYGIFASNTSASARWLKLYDKASAPTVGSDTPVLTLLIPPNSGGFSVQQALGISFALGIAFGITAAATDADTTAIGAGECVINILYK